MDSLTGVLAKIPSNNSSRVSRALEKSRALALGGDGARGAAQVQVHLVIAHGRQLSRGPEEIFHIPGEQLGYGAKTRVVFRQNPPQLPGCEHVVLGGGEEGHVVGVHAAEHLVVGAAELRPGDSLHGGKIVLHALPSSHWASSVRSGAIWTQG